MSADFDDMVSFTYNDCLMSLTSFSICHTNTLEYFSWHTQPVGVLLFVYVVNHSGSYLIVIVLACKSWTNILNLEQMSYINQPTNNNVSVCWGDLLQTLNIFRCAGLLSWNVFALAERAHQTIAPLAAWVYVSMIQAEGGWLKIYFRSCWLTIIQ